MADQAINALPTKDTPESTDQLLVIGEAEEKLIDYDKLADAILNKLTSKKFEMDTGTQTIMEAIASLNGKSTHKLLRVASEKGFSETIKGNNNKLIAGYFYMPHDNPFSFNTGYYIAFQADYITEMNSYTILGISMTGYIECKLINLK